MMQRLLKTLIRTIANTFFRRIDVVGLEHVPAAGPVIFAGNHPNALMDGWLLTARCRRWPLHFLANAKLWRYPLLGRCLDATGAVPVYPRAEFGDEASNDEAFRTLYEVIERGDCVGVFPEGVSHAQAHLAELKTGTARIALGVASRGKVPVTIVPVGLNYINRSRFRSQVLMEFGNPLTIDDDWISRFREAPEATVRRLTELLAACLAAVTLNAPDWQTLQSVQTARRLYKPTSAKLTPTQYVQLSRRFLDGYRRAAGDPELQAAMDEVREYQARLDALGLMDYQLRQPIDVGVAYRRIVWRAVKLLLMLPLAIPAALLHLPVAWIAATVGNRFSYEMDDVATLKVFATVALLPLIYGGVAIIVGMWFGAGWGVLAILLLGASFIATIRLIETQATLLHSVTSLFRLTRLRSDVEDMRQVRATLVSRVRAFANRYADPNLPRIFSDDDFATRGGNGP